MTVEEKLAEAVILANQILEKRNAELAEAKEKIRQLTPRAQYTEHVLDSKSLHTVNSIAVYLGVSAIRLNQFLEEQGWIYREGRDIYPCSAIRGKGLCGFHVVVYAYDIDGNPKTREHLKWTEQGRKAVIELWNKVHGLLI